MTDHFRVTALDEAHIGHFGDILKESVRADLGRFVIDNQRGYLDYLRLIVRFPESFPHHRLRVLVDAQDRLAAFADFRLPSPDAGFLSALVVFPQFRGRGLSTRLFRCFAAEFPDTVTLGLDVFADNDAAIGLYTSLGFHPVATHHWLMRHVQPGPHGIAVADLPHVIGMHAAYGFTRFTVPGHESHGSIGLLGEDVINCFEEAAFTDTVFLAAVARTFTRRIAFHSTADIHLAETPGITHLHTSVRMELPDFSALRSP